MTNREVTATADLVVSNRKPLAQYIRQKLIAAGAKHYLDGLGKEGIEALENEAAGLVLEVACALFRRLNSTQEYQVEAMLHVLPKDVQSVTRLPRSEAYHSVLGHLNERQGG